MAVDVGLRRRPRYQAEFIGDGLGGIEDIRREFFRLAEYLPAPALDAIHWTVWAVLPDRPREGMQMYFAAGVAGAGAGLYLYKGGAWSPL